MCYQFNATEIEKARRLMAFCNILRISLGHFPPVFPVNSLFIREFGGRDGFAADCAPSQSYQRVRLRSRHKDKRGSNVGSNIDYSYTIAPWRAVTSKIGTMRGELRRCDDKVDATSKLEVTHFSRASAIKPHARVWPKAADFASPTVYVAYVRAIRRRGHLRLLVHRI